MVGFPGKAPQNLSAQTFCHRQEFSRHCGRQARSTRVEDVPRLQSYLLPTPSPNLSTPWATFGGSDFDFSDGEQCRQGNSIPGTVFNMMKNVIGTGLLTMPWAFREGSLGPSVFVLFVSAVMLGYSLVIIARCCILANTYIYAQLWERAFGRRTAPIVNAVVWFCVYFGCVAYEIFIGDFMSAVIRHDVIGNRNFLVPVITTIILFPLCCFKELKSLRYFSFTGITAVMLTVVVLVWQAIKQGDAGQEVKIIDINPNIFSTIGIMILSFVCHYNSPSFYKELHDRSIERYKVVVTIAFTAITTIFCIFSVAGYLMFGAETEGNILNSPFKTDLVYIDVVRVAMTVCVLFCFPIVFHALRLSTHGFTVLILGEAYDEENKTNQYNQRKLDIVRLIEIVILLVTIVLIALAVGEVEIINMLSGSTAGAGIGLIFPGMIYLRLNKKITLFDKVFCYVLICFGFLTAILAVSNYAGAF